MKKFHVVVEKEGVYGIYHIEAEKEEQAKDKAIQLFWKDIHFGTGAHVSSINEMDDEGVPTGI
jgi:hypothetical protein